MESDYLFGMEGVFILLAIGILVAVVISPFVIIGLITKVNKLESRLSDAELDIKELRVKAQKFSKAKLEEKKEPESPKTLPARNQKFSEKVEAKPKPIIKEQEVSEAKDQNTSPPPLPRMSPPFPAPPAEPSSAAVWLTKMGLMPPDSSTSGANLMAWWSTRIGLVFGVIAAVFLGLYVNKNTVPWVRLLELVTAAAGVFGVGFWLEKKLKIFGRALTAGGLALLFVAAYAAYGLPAMKVIYSPVLGTLVQVVVLVLTVLWSLLRGREPVFSLALVLSYVTCWFSATEGLPGVALISILILSLAGSCMFGWKQWWSGIWAATLGSGLGLTILALSQWSVDSGPSIILGLGSAIAVTVFPLIASSWQWQRGEGKARGVVPLITSIGLFAGAVITHVRGFDFVPYYACFAVLLILTGWWWRRDEKEDLWQTVWAKASVLIALLLIAMFDGPVRSFSLLAQAGGLIFIARTRSRAIFEVGAVIAAIAGWCFLWPISVEGGVETWQPSHYAGFGYLLGALCLVMLYRYLLGESHERRVFSGLLSFVITVIFLHLSEYRVSMEWGFLLPIGFGCFSLLQVWPLRQKDAVLIPFTVLLGALLILVDRWFLDLFPTNVLGGWQSLVWLCFAWGFCYLFGKQKGPMPKVLAMIVLWSSVVAIGMAGSHLVGFEWLPAIAFLTAILWHVVGQFLKIPFLSRSSVLPGCIGVCLVLSIASEIGAVSLRGDITSIVMAFVWWVVAHKKWVDNKDHEVFSYVRSAALGVVTFALLSVYFDGDILVMLCMLVSLLALIGWGVIKDASLSWVSAAIFLMGFGMVIFVAGDYEVDPWVIALLATQAAVYGVWIARSQSVDCLAHPKLASVLWGSVFMITVFSGLGFREYVLAWTTAVWALAAVSLLVCGFWGGLRGYRIIALVGIALAILRMFTVDIQNSFWRIIAFGVTGALLLGIGYLYSRYYKRLAENDLDWKG